MYCTGFQSHSASHTGSRPWCGSACLAGRPPICASSGALSFCAGSGALSLLVQAVVHCGPLSTVICNNADPFFFRGWYYNLEWTSNRSKAPPRWCLFSTSTTFSRLLFSAWPGSGAPLSRDLEGALYKF